MSIRCSIKDGYGWVRWHTPVIPALLETKVGGSRDQEMETSLTNMVKPHLYKRYKKDTKISWAWWHMPIVPITWEAEARGLLEARILRQAWATL